MQISHFVGLVGIVAFFSCVSSNTSLNRVEVYSDKDFPAIDSSEWSYPWYVILHDDGYFENTAGDSIEAKDTVHIIHNAQCAILVNGDNSGYPDSLLFCKARLKADTLEIEIYNEGAYGSIELWVWKFNGNFKCRYESSSPVLNTDYSQTQFEKQKLLLNKKEFKRGETVKGTIEVVWKHQYSKGRTSKNSVKGSFEAVIE